METLKADFHIHTAEDPYDVIKWDAKRIIEEGARRGFRVLALTWSTKYRLDFAVVIH